MAGPTLAFREVVRRMAAPKPPLACRVVELRDDAPTRVATVLFDGLEGWHIDDGERTEFRSSDDRVVFDSGGRLERSGPGSGVVHSNAWVKTPIEGWRMNLEGITGRVLGHEPVDGRETALLEAHGLRAGEDTVFLMHVDIETGVVLRIARPDLGTVLRIEDFRIGTVTPGRVGGG